MRAGIPLICVFALAGPDLGAQPNTIPGLDTRFVNVSGLVMAGRLGTFPTGRNGLALSTTICNVGSVPITWLRAMNPRHPMYGFSMCRESNGRFEQISDRSFAKHAFSAANQNGCGVCTTSVRTQLGLACSDTYRVQANQNRFNLGPADEIDPWLGTWNPVGSHFDRGEPDVGPPQNMDGERSLTGAQTAVMDPVTHRVEVDDADLNVAGARYFFASHVVILGEAESLRTDNLSSVETVPQWNGTSWVFSKSGGAVSGSILRHWTGAALNSAANGTEDGRFYVAVVVTGPDSRGLWHYEYAVHNRDNSRAAAALRIPLCSAARVLNASFRDIDKDPSNDWQVTVAGGEVIFATASASALEWNTIYNFSFDSDAEPAPGQVALDQARPGPGAPSVSVAADVPTGVVHTESLGGGCGGPSLWPAGSPPYAAIPNPSFAVQLEGLQPQAAAVLMLSGSQGSVSPGGGCVLHALAPPMFLVLGLVADPGGRASVGLGIPASPAYEGLELYGQGAELAAGGPLLGALNLTDALRIRIGNALTCQ